ncbi:MAG: enediyne biosynthesis protein [Chloroflexota bacterium]|nr:enediyne biosynthesis protein [Chloroflexota bacterium]
MASIDAAPPRGLSVPQDSGRPPAPRGVKRRTAHIRGREYQVVLPSLRDPRLHVAAVLLTLQVLGQTVLGFRLSIAQILVCLATGALIEFLVAFFKDRAILWPASGLLTGNSTAFILRVPGTLHGQWWSTHGIEIFIGVVALGMATKYLIRWKGRHIFNPSNVALVIAFIALGPQHTEPLDLWWIPMGLWMTVTYVILVGGGLLIAWELRMLGLVLGFMAAFAAFVAIALTQAPDHCMVASWHVTPMCGRDLWQVLVTSPEVLIFALFMIPDPRTVPDGQVARVVFGIVVAMLAVLLLGPTTLEFWTKTAILASLVIACALRFALVAFLSPFVSAGWRGWVFGGFRWQVPAALAVALLCVGALPVAADLSTHSPQPFAERPDGTFQTIPLTVGAGPALAGWVTGAAGAALPPSGNAGPASASARVWILPPIPQVSIASNVRDFDSTMTPTTAARLAHSVVFDLIIESEARRAHDLKLAASGADADALTEFTDVIKQDIAAKKTIQKTYSFDSISLQLFLPKFASQAARLVGVTVHGTATLTTMDASGNVLSKTNAPYVKTWGVYDSQDGSPNLIYVDYTGLALAP